MSCCASTSQLVLHTNLPHNRCKSRIFRSEFICKYFQIHSQIVFLTLFLVWWATKRGFYSFSIHYSSFFFPHRRVREKKWIKNCCIHMKIFFVCKHFTYVSVTTRKFFFQLFWGEETWIQEMSYSWLFCCLFSSFGPVNLTIEMAALFFGIAEILLDGASSFATRFLVKTRF